MSTTDETVTKANDVKSDSRETRRSASDDTLEMTSLCIRSCSRRGRTAVLRSHAGAMFSEDVGVFARRVSSGEGESERERAREMPEARDILFYCCF